MIVNGTDLGSKLAPKIQKFYFKTVLLGLFCEASSTLKALSQDSECDDSAPGVHRLGTQHPEDTTAEQCIIIGTTRAPRGGKKKP